MSDYGESPSYDGDRRTGWAELGSGETVELARIGARFGARILDIIFVFVIYMAVLMIMLGGWVLSDEDSGVFSGGLAMATLIGPIVWLVYEGVQVAVSGRTLGKRMTGIKIINAAHGGVPGWGKSVGRWVIPGLISLIPLAGLLLAVLCYVSATWDRVYQGWHDKAAGTLVVKQ